MNIPVPHSILVRELNVELYDRARFLDALIKNIDPQKTHHNKRCQHISQSDSGLPLVHFDDGTTYEADVVLGADGIKSAVRTAVIGKDAPKPVIYSSTACYRGLISVEAVRAAGVVTELAQRPVCFVGLNKVRASCITCTLPPFLILE